ncbi:zinc finger protein 600-like [Ochlerotatus camptorhynchus]|uniref:zinc finger protein 600-like n=1 Tax=Ochlerotatus camptorhynchus TaxID=644619 RepID=UPI0031CEA12F
MYCCIRSCPAKYGKAAVSFHRFPQNNETRRQRWIEAAGRGNCINYDYAMICSRHFVGGRPARVSDCDSVSWVPSLLLDNGMSDEDALARRLSVDTGVVDRASIQNDDGEEVNCAVRGCGMTKEENPSLLFFSVPRDAGDRRKWLVQIGMLNNAIEINKNNFLAVCELHFDLAKDLLNYDDVITMGSSAMLQEHVMPTRNIPTVFGHQKVRFTHEAPDNPTSIKHETQKPEEDDDEDDDDVMLLEEMGERNGEEHGMPEYPSHMQPSPVEEFVQICRSCLSTDKTNLVSAYDDRLAEIFFQFTNVNIDENDGISTMICVDCKSRLLDIHFFRDTCVTNTQILIHRYQKCYGMAPDGGNNDQQHNEIMQYDDEEVTSQYVQSPTKYNRYDMGADDPEDLLMPQKEQLETVSWKPKPGRPRKLIKPEPVPLKKPTKVVPQIATMKKRFKCKFCRKEYNSRPGFDMHMATHKYHSQSEFIIECKRCDVRSRKNEVHRCYTDILYCYVCGEQYRKWSYLKLHLAKVHKIKTKRLELMLKLKEMGYVGGSRANALKIPPSNRRIPQDSDNEVEIKVPVEDPDSEKSNSAHSDRSSPTDLRPKCSFCGVSFRQNSCLEMHMKTHSAIELTQCNECDSNFNAYRHLERHHEDHEDENPLDSSVKCRFCGKNLKRNQTLLLHYQYVHKDKDVVQCSTCPQLVENATQLARHTCSGQEKNILSSSAATATTTTTTTTNGDFMIIQPESILKGASTSITMNDDSNSVPVGLHGGDGADPLLGLGNDEVIELDSDTDDDDDESSREKPSFDCSVCDKTFEKEDTLDRHMKLHRMMSAAKANEIGLRNCFFRAMNCRP